MSNLSVQEKVYLIKGFYSRNKSIEMLTKHFVLSMEQKKCLAKTP